jgi:hypothetical protein
MWHGAYTRGNNCLLRIRYSWFQDWKHIAMQVCQRTLQPHPAPIRLVHAFHEPPNGHICDQTIRRNRAARRTWAATDVMGKRISVSIRLEDLPRTFHDKDRQMVFVRDLIDAAAAKCESKNDVILLCNSDTCFAVDFYDKVVEKLKTCSAFCGPRRDFARLDDMLTPDQIRTGQDYVGTDLFVFTPQWWSANRNQFPDMVFGAEAWDLIARETMLKQGSTPLMDVIYHERHPGRWSRSENRYTLPSQLHNFALARKALTNLNIGWRPGMFGIK